MEVPHLNYFIEENSLFQGANVLLRVFRPHWDLSDVQFKVFTDGITNKLIGCFNSQHKADVVLIRINGNKTDLLIDRNNERRYIKWLHTAGLAPALYGTFENGLVYEYVPGEVLTPQTCRKDSIYTLVARKMADMHKLLCEEPPTEPVLWIIIPKFMSQIPKKFSNTSKAEQYDKLFIFQLDLEAEYEFLKKELSRLSSPVVLCHNDLLLGNIIYNGEKNSVEFIDYEYTGYNYQAYDIANHFNEFAGVETVDYSLFPDEIFQKKWLRTYLEKYKSRRENSCDYKVSEEDVEALRLDVEKFTLASHFLWGVWSLLQNMGAQLQTMGAILSCFTCAGGGGGPFRLLYELQNGEDDKLIIKQTLKGEEKGSFHWTTDEGVKVQDGDCLLCLLTQTS